MNYLEGFAETLTIADENHYFTVVRDNDGNKILRSNLCGFPEDNDIVSFNVENGFKIIGDLKCFNEGVQQMIINYLHDSNSEYWFHEKKYNVIIGRCNLGNEFIIYTKFGGYYTSHRVKEDKLKLSENLFTKEEIDDLKLTLSDDFKKIVEIGKVEFKDK